MIRLITGLPGSGKTLLAVELIKQNSSSEDIRPVFSNISGLAHDKLRTFELENPDTWYDLPPHSIIIIDECQRWFRPRPNGSTVPKFISELETHRHYGHDIILITQHPRLVDIHVRKLVEQHQHVVRPFGMNYRKLHEWQSCNEDPAPSTTEKDALVKKIAFDKKLYDCYKSATVHVVKKRIPYKKLAVAIACLLAAPALFAYSVYSVSNMHPASAGENNLDKTQKREEQGDHKVKPSTFIEKKYDGEERELKFRGYQQSIAGMRLFLEDASGAYMTLEDFTGYQKQGAEVLFFVEGPGYSRKYRVSDRQLSMLLP